MVATVQDQASDFKRPQFAGPYGNLSTWAGQYKPGAVRGVTGDTVVVDIARIPAGSRAHKWYAVFSALGTAASMAIGFRWENSDPALFIPPGAPTPAADFFDAATAVAAAGEASAYFLPVVFPIAAVLTATFSASSGANILPANAEILLGLEGISQGV